MKILILTPRIPYPLRDGGAIAMHQTIEGYLQAGCDVSLLAMNTSRHWVEVNELPELYSRLSYFDSVYINNSINPISAFFNLFTDKSYNVNRFVNKQFEKALIKTLLAKKYDVIQFESIYTSPYLDTARQFSDAKCVCRVHNIEHQIWQRLADNETIFLKKNYLRLLTSRLKQYELDVLRKFDGLLPISKVEESYILKNNINRTLYLPFAVEDFQLTDSIETELKSCYHIGSMDWAPNVEGVDWFLNDVWSEVKQLFEDHIFYIAGKNMPAGMRKRNDFQTRVVGEIDDFIEFSLSKNIMIVPLLSGGGIRIKILEAMALGKTIISTSIGAEGIGAVSGKHIWIADTKEEFVDALRICFSNPELSSQIGQQAKKFVLEHYKKADIYNRIVSQLNHWK